MEADCDWIADDPDEGVMSTGGVACVACLVARFLRRSVGSGEVRGESVLETVDR